MARINDNYLRLKSSYLFTDIAKRVLAIQGKGGKVYNLRNGFCLETQHFPDSPNHPDFPSTILKPGQTFHSETVFKFSTE